LTALHNAYYNQDFMVILNMVIAMAPMKLQAKC